MIIAAEIYLSELLSEKYIHLDRGLNLGQITFQSFKNIVFNSLVTLRIEKKEAEVTDIYLIFNLPDSLLGILSVSHLASEQFLK